MYLSWIRRPDNNYGHISKLVFEWLPACFLSSVLLYVFPFFLTMLEIMYFKDN